MPWTATALVLVLMMARSLPRRTLVGAAAALSIPREYAMASQPSLDLPSIGLGTCCDEAEVARDLIVDGLAAGFRLLDTSSHYPSESVVGEAIEIAEARGIVRRRDVTVCTKVWFDDMGYEPALASAVRSLSRLRAEQLDLLLIHFPGTIDAVQEPKRNSEVRRATWRALEQLQADGRVRNIGISK